MIISRTRKDTRRYRRLRIRAKVKGTAERPRMAIMVSNKHIHIQFIDDDKAVTIASVSTQAQEKKCSIASAISLGKRAIEAVCAKGIKRVVIDRGGFKFHGRVKAIVDETVKAGLVAGATEEK